MNSGAEDSWPSFSSDGRRFFFSSERGFATYRPEKAMSWAQFERGLTSILNGMGNIYEADAGVFDRPALAIAQRNHRVDARDAPGRYIACH